MASEDVNHPTKSTRARMKIDMRDRIIITPPQEDPHAQRETDQKKLEDLLHGLPTRVPFSSHSAGQSIMGSNVFDFSMLSERLPTIIWRSRWDRIAEQVGLPYRRGYMQNLDSEGAGPVKQVLNNRIYYKSEDVIRWLNERQSKHRES